MATNPTNEPTFYLDRADDGTWVVCSEGGFRQPVCRNRAVARGVLRFHETRGREGIASGYRTQEDIADRLQSMLATHYSRTTYRGDAFIGERDHNRFVMSVPAGDGLMQRFIIEVREVS